MSKDLSNFFFSTRGVTVFVWTTLALGGGIAALQQQFMIFMSYSGGGILHFMV